MNRLIRKASKLMQRDLQDDVAQIHAHFCLGLSDPKRVLIVRALSNHVVSVGTLAKTVRMSQAATSRNLRILRDGGIVHSERQGQSVIYTLTDPRIIEVLNLVHGIMADQIDNRLSSLSR